MEAKNRNVYLKGGVTKRIINNISGICEPGYHVRKYFREFGFSIWIWLETNWYSGFKKYWLNNKSVVINLNVVAFLCENLCEKNFPKSAKIRKNRKKSGKSYLTISVAYNNLRRLGNSEAVTENPRVGSSILSLGTINWSTYEIFVGAFFA